MKIILYVNSFLPLIGGRELVVHYLARALNDLGHNVRVLGPSKIFHNWRNHYGYRVHRYPRLFRRKRSKNVGEKVWLQEKELQLQLLLDTKIWGCDVIHAHSTYPCGYIADIFKQNKKVPVVITPHGNDIHKIPELDHGMILNPLLEPKITQAIAQADALTAISDSVSSSLLDAGAREDNIYKVPNGVDIQRFQSTHRQDLRKLLSLSSDAKLVVTVGNYHPRKGHEVLVRSMKLVLEKNPQAHLIIVGRKTDVLRPLISELGLQNNVSLLGEVAFPANMDGNDSDMLADIYHSSDLYVSAGIDEDAEGLSLAVLEAMAANLPVVGSDISGNRDIIEHGVNGYLVTPSNHEVLAENIIQIFADDNARSSMGAASLEAVSKYSWENIAGLYLGIYKQVIDRGNSA